MDEIVISVCFPKTKVHFYLYSSKLVLHDLIPIHLFPEESLNSNYPIKTIWCWRQSHFRVLENYNLI